MPRGFQLVFTEGPYRGQERQFVVGEVTVGRGEDCDLQLPDAGVSRRHCRISPDGTGNSIEDLGSKRGTRVNGQLVQKQRLRRGDRVSIGATVFTYTADDLPEFSVIGERTTPERR